MSISPFTVGQLAQCAEREVAQRRKVYSRLVERQQMTQAAADREIAMMLEIARRLNAEADADPLAAGRLL